jgi:hypothetical protein
MSASSYADTFSASVCFLSLFAPVPLPYNKEFCYISNCGRKDSAPGTRKGREWPPRMYLSTLRAANQGKNRL